MKHLSLFLVLLLFSCKGDPKKEVQTETSNDHLVIAKNYYAVLNHTDAMDIATLLGDSIVIRESEDNYEERKSKKDYINWWQWESVFEPTYKVQQLAKVDGTVKATVWKFDKRLSFLHDEPVIWTEIIYFDDNNKISKVDRINYEVFDGAKFVYNRDPFVQWIAKNHPELDGFIYDQTKAGGINYLKAMELYKSKGK